MNACVIVAHPDDCIIFAYSLMYQHPKLDWSICYLTYTEHTIRGRELKEFWNKRNIPTVFLGYVDDWHDIENKKISFDEEQARLDIQQVAQGQDIVVTHDANGDYGHIHHIFVHDVIVGCHSNVITFAGIGQGTTRYTIPAGIYSLDEFPTHREVIEGFHRNGHINEYFIPNDIKEQLNRL